jgi:hypothetical protein
MQKLAKILTTYFKMNTVNATKPTRINMITVRTTIEPLELSFFFRLSSSIIESLCAKFRIKKKEI